MNYITEIFERADIRHIREFLLYGSKCREPDNSTYKQRLENSLNNALTLARGCFPEGCEQLEDKLLIAANAHEQVYMEIGIQVGMKLAVQIFGFRK